MRLLPLFLTTSIVAIGGFGLYQAGYLDSWTDQPENVFVAANAPPSNGNGGFSASNTPPILAQATPAPSQTPSIPPHRGASLPQVDETALRYFANRGDTRRLQAEIARLKALYPQWTPPADPLAIQQNGDPELERMWRLYSENKFAEVRKAIGDRQTKEPNWQVPADLLDRLAVAEAREQLINASNLKQYETVVRVASGNPSLLICSEVDVLWRLAEAFAKTDRDQRATDAYRYILTNCEEGEAERLATIQKALPLLPRTQLDTLLATEKTDASGAGEFVSIRDDLARKSVSDAGQDAAQIIDQKELSIVENLARTENKASDSLLLGWYNLRRESFTASEQWFRRANTAENTAESAQGLALALVGLSKFAEAELTLYQWRDTSEEIRAVYLAATANLLAVEPPVPLAPEVLQRIVPEVARARDPANAQQLGWYALALNQFQTAARWFSTALEWKPDDEPSAYGLALTNYRLGENAAVNEIQAAWRGRSERIARLRDASNARPGGRTTAPPTSDYTPMQETGTVSRSPAYVAPNDNEVGSPSPPRTAEADPAPVTRLPRVAPRPRETAAPVRNTPSPRGCTSTVAPESLSAQAALNRGWCLMEINRPLEAAPAFEVALQRGSAKIREDAAYGQSLAYLRAGLSKEAAVAAAKSPQNQQRTVELRTSLLSSQALDSFEAGRYVETLLALDERARIAAERLDLMTLRGYAYLRLRRLNDAQKVFEAVAATGNSEGRRGLAAVMQAREAQ
ncbi:cellulose synthase [Mesorhizobium sp. SB112]|uniref:cellulose synthase n=1 Tax=Mesorhizobium sp. SB112 TaxID=3151853 RepID=UPI0032660265